MSPSVISSSCGDSNAGSARHRTRAQLTAEHAGLGSASDIARCHGSWARDRSIELPAARRLHAMSEFAHPLKRGSRSSGSRRIRTASGNVDWWVGGRAMGGQDEDTSRWKAAHDECQHVSSAGVGPLEIVDDDDERRLVRRSHLEQNESRPARAHSMSAVRGRPSAARALSRAGAAAPLGARTGRRPGEDRRARRSPRVASAKVGRAVATEHPSSNGMSDRRLEE